MPRRVHGSDQKIRRTESASDGSYHFDTTGLHDCDFFVARAVKAGYRLDHLTDRVTHLALQTYSEIPQIVYLIKESDQPMVLLDRLSDFMPAAPFVAGPHADSIFGEIFGKFIESKPIATTPAMVTWVREHYCARLQTAWDVLTDQQRAKIHYNGIGEFGPVSALPDSYEKEVLPYCRA